MPRVGTASVRQLTLLLGNQGMNPALGQEEMTLRRDKTTFWNAYWRWKTFGKRSGGCGATEAHRELTG